MSSWISRPVDPDPRVPGRTPVLPLIGLALAAGGIALVSGPPSFDYIDGTEFVIAGRNMDLTHPPGYPLYVSFLRLFSLTAPCGSLDYSCFRLFSAMVAGALSVSAWAALRSMGAGYGSALAGSAMIATSAPVLAQLNLVEVHGAAMALALAAVALRRSRAGPYSFSLALFGGHPISVCLLPAALSRRYRQRWVVLAAVPASLWLFVPLRSTFPGLCHYSRPGGAIPVWRYLGLYGRRLDLPSLEGPGALAGSMGIPALIAVLMLVILSRRWSWRLFLSFSAGLLFISSYSIPDTESIAWIAALPLLMWASLGLTRLLEGSGPGKLAAALLLAVSVLGGTVQAWRGGDRAAETIAGDYLRGAPPEAAFVTSGMSTFHTAYMLEVLDRRPDIVPMDSHRCLFRIPPPDVLPAAVGGRPLVAVRAWDSDDLHLHGLLFGSGQGQVDWSSYEVYAYEGPVHDGFASDEMAEMWARRGIQAGSSDERLRCREKALDLAVSDMTRERVRILFEQY